MVSLRNILQNVRYKVLLQNFQTYTINLMSFLGAFRKIAKSDF